MNGKKKLRKVVAIITVLCMLLSMEAGLITAFAEDGNEAYCYQTNGVSQEGSSLKGTYVSGSIFSQETALFSIKDISTNNGGTYEAYCVDMSTTIRNNHLYARTTLDAAGYYSAADGKMIRAIVLNTVPNISLSALRSASGISKLTQKDAICGSQWAIWSYANNNSVKAPKSSDNSNEAKLYRYLTSLSPAGAYATEPIVINVNSYQDGNSIIFDYSATQNISALNNQNIVIKAGSKVLTKDKDYIIKNNVATVDVSNYTQKTTFTFDIEGDQQLARDAYFYYPKGGVKASQSLVSAFEGSSKVSKSSSVEFDPSLITADLTVQGRKTLTGRALNSGEFTFLIKDKDGKTVSTGTNDSDGNVEFAPLTFSREQVGKTFNYTISEANKGETVNGVTYDDAVVKLKVEVKNVSGKLTLVPTYMRGSKVVSAPIDFVNSYKAAPVKNHLDVTKTISGRTFQKGDDFTFNLSAAGSDEVMDTVTTTATSGNSQTVSFHDVEYTKAGTYEYVISEVVPEATRGVTYAEDVTATVTVIDNTKTGKLEVEKIEYSKGGDSALFENKYKAAAVTTDLNVTKQLQGREFQTGDAFSFNLTAKGSSSVISTVSTSATSGNSEDLTFSNLEFTEAGTYEYVISEVVPEDTRGVTYAEDVTATVTVTDNTKTGKLEVESVEYSCGGDAALFVNHYSPASVSGKLIVEKQMAGRDFMPGDEFTFSLYEEKLPATDADTPEPVDTVNTASISGTSERLPFKEITYDKAGIYKYIIKELVPEATNGITYADDVTVTVSVKDNTEKGNLEIESIEYSNGITAATFQNTYKAAAVSNALSLQKQLDGRTFQKGDNFTFKLYQEGSDILLDTVSTTAESGTSQTLSFNSMDYTEAGTYEYVIKEAVPEETCGVTYAEDVKATVVIEDNTKVGRLVVKSVDYSRGEHEALFTNSYEPAPVDVQLNVTKVLKGRDFLAGDSFEFQLYEKDGQSAIDTVCTTATEGSTQDLSFDSIEYTEAGTYDYVIKETVPENTAGITYAGDVTASVTVADNTKTGKLEVEKIEYSSGTDSALFENTYKGQGIITVNCNVFLNGKPHKSGKVFPIGLFENEECTSPAKYADGTEVELLDVNMNGNSSATVCFEGLEYGTYYLAQIGSNGKPLPEGEVKAVTAGNRILAGTASRAELQNDEDEAFKHVVEYRDKVLTLDENDKEGIATINNYLYNQDFYLKGTIKVTKVVTLNGQEKGTGQSYYTALFADEDCTQIVSEVLPIEMNGNSRASAVFTNLATDRTYYVAETDQSGEPLDEDAWGIDEITVDNGEITFGADDNNYEEEATITNAYKNDDNYLYDGSVKVIKKVTRGGKDYKTDKTFYFTLFSDEDMTDAVDTVSIKMKGRSTAVKTFEGLERGTYYVAETDEDGTVLDKKAAAEKGFKIVADTDEATVDSSEAAEVNFENQFSSPGTGGKDDGNANKNKGNGSDKGSSVIGNAVRTADEYPVETWMLIITFAMLIMACCIVRIRNKKYTK